MTSQSNPNNYRNWTEYELHQFCAKVKEMRDAQKKYFKYRDPFSLSDAKKLEKEVDKFFESTEGTPMVSLFDNIQQSNQERDLTIKDIMQ